MCHIQIHIQGNLRGTGYMYLIKQIASLYGITGFARYKEDGSIWVSAAGKKEPLKKFVEVSKIGTYNTHIDQFDTVEVSNNNGTNWETFDIQ